MRHGVKLAAACAALLLLGPARAADNTLLIQLQPNGAYKVWHVEGETRLAEEELLNLEALATPEGSGPFATSAGPARAYAVAEGTRIVLADAPRDKELLVERDACGGLKAWHAEGATRLGDEQLTELVLSAEPGGGKTIAVGLRHAKAFLTRVGVVATFWLPVKR